MVVERDRFELVYGFDPLCGWCYAFGKSVHHLRQVLGERVRLRIACVGMVTGTEVAPVREFATQLRATMRSVQARTGVLFGERFAHTLLKSAWLRDSEPASRAVLVAQSLAPERALDFANGLTTAYHGCGLEPDAPATLRAVAMEVGIDDAELLARWSESSMVEGTRQHFRQTRESGITAQPSLFLCEHGALIPIAIGYCDGPALVERVLARTGSSGGELCA